MICKSICKFWKFIQYNIYWDKTQMLKKFPLWKFLFFFHELQLIVVLLLIRSSYTSWSTRAISLKLCVGFSIFDSVSFLLNVIFLLNKKHTLFDLKVGLSPSKKVCFICFNKRLLKIMKNTFYFILSRSQDI